MQAIFQKYDIQLTDEQIGKFEDFLDLFLEKNALINLSAIRDPDEIITKHFVDSLMLTKFLPEILNNLKLKTCPPRRMKLEILDLGTGGGFPGIPLAIYYPDHHFTLLDTRKKKCLCVAEFVEKLGLKNVSVVWGRAQNLEEWKYISAKGTVPAGRQEVLSDKGKPTQNLKLKTQNFSKTGKFDYVVSRATAHLAKLQAWSTGILKKGGTLIAYKTPSKEELSEAKEPINILPYTFEGKERFFVVYESP